MSFEEFFAHPFVLLIAGVIFSGFFIPWLTRKTQYRRQNMEIKKDLVREIGKATTMIIRQMSCGISPDKDKKQVFLEWRKDSSTIGATMIAYYGNSSIVEDWDQLYYAITRFFIIFESLDNDIENEKQDLKDYCSNPKYLSTDDEKITSKEINFDIIERFFPVIPNTKIPKEIKRQWNVIKKFLKFKKYDLLENIVNTDIGFNPKRQKQLKKLNL